jgi:hypothetical protein
MLATILSFVTGFFPTINGITAAISNEKIALINAKTAEESTHANERILQFQAQRDLMIAEQGKPITWDGVLRTFITIGPAAFLFKVFMWDKVLGAWTHGSTDPLDPNLWLVVQVVLGFYFVSSMPFFRKK